MSIHWQHENPLQCPHGHTMTWLGDRYWICGRSGCNKVYVELMDEGAQVKSESDPVAECTKTGGCWLPAGHDGHCD